MEVWSTVGQAAIGWLVEGILGSLFTEKLISWFRQVNLDEDVEKLVWEMRNVAVVLEAAKGMKIHENDPLAGSLFNLKDLLYDAEDVLDELDYYQLKEKIIKGNSEEDTVQTISSFFPIRWFTGWKRKREENHAFIDDKSQFSVTTKQIAGKLRDACSDVSKGLKINGLLKSPEASNLSHQSTPPATNATTSSYLLEPIVYGRDEEMESIRKLIMTNNSNRSNGITILPIVGNGGIGKTTLAQLVYKDSEIGKSAIKIWVHVSDKFDLHKVTREILECVSKKKQKETSNFNMLQQDLEKHMKSKRFLIVLDDVWDVTTDSWNKLLAPLIANHVNPSQEKVTGNSVIIVTTRNRTTAEFCGTVRSINLGGLEDDGIWSLFKVYAFGSDRHGSDPNLQNLGRKIAKELKGNPLAAKTVGSLLRRNLTVDHWSSIIENKEWQSLQHTDGIMHALKFSYDHLPSHLQQCFSYCSLFPKGYYFNEAQLIHIWIAQGFVERSSENLEQKGREYLAELVNSGFYQQVEIMWPTLSEEYVVHDLMHDLARMVSQTECATIDGSECKELAPSIRHLSILTDSAYWEEPNGNISRNEEFEKRLLKVTSRSKLRTLILIGQHDTLFFQSFQNAFKEAQHLRLLHMTSKYANFDSFLSKLVNYIHLRYLRVENEEFQGALPQALDKCYHLQVLDINSCTPDEYFSDSDMSSEPSMDMEGEGERLPKSDIEVTFPTWFATSLASLQALHLENCGKWQILSLDRLCLLKKLVLIRMSNAVEVIIRSLEELVLIEMPKLKRCSCTSVTSVRIMNYSLRVLTIKSCPELELFPLFENCHQFNVKRASWFFRLCKLTIHDCPNLSMPHSLPPSTIVSELSISRVSTLPTMEGSSSGTLRIGLPISSSSQLFDGDSDQLTTLNYKVLSFHNMRFLTGLVINGCQHLTSISFKGLRKLICLKSLEIYSCPEFLSSDVPSELICKGTTAENRDALPSLECLTIISCGITGKWLSLMMEHAQALQELCLVDCKNITGLSIGQEEASQPNIMSSLEASSLGYPDDARTSSAQDGLLRIPLNLISSLKKISVRECSDISFIDSDEGFARFASLEELSIDVCDDLAEKLLPCLLGNAMHLKKLQVEAIFLKSLQLQSCMALEELDILCCESLTALEGFQSLRSLRCLKVWECSGFVPCLEGLSRQGHQLFPRLERLVIDDPSILNTSFRSQLTSLTRLELSGCSNEVERLTDEQDNGLQHLTSLEELQFSSCIYLKDLPAGLHNLPSLKKLEISECKKIVQLPNEGLPPSLEELDISYCSRELSDQCRTLANKLKVKIRPRILDS
ncbi:disease resistance protein RGA2-like [Oryza brachyantha]|uniref:disease resistance protein RGA2-like n=1 Tax=Oryza brachyantha TaxID=4533 RepID=UPI001ADAAF98|nr:disease resistance protein RGA2-like [Oryza brachyantha]